ncbi:MAG: MFS transporter [Knoellia sp.]
MSATDTTVHSSPGPRAGAREWIGLATLLLPTALALMDEGILFLAVPRIVADLDVDSAGALWIIDIYGFMVAAFMISMGRLADRVGARRLLFIAAAIFSVFSVAASMAPTAETLIAYRAAMGISGAAIGPCVFALIKQMFPNTRQMATAMAMATTSALVGVLLGPAVGGLLLDSHGWRTIFLIALPVMVLLLVVGPFTLSEIREENPGSVDVPSVLLSLAAFLPIIYGVTTLARVGVRPLPLAAVVLGLAVGTTFVRRQRQLAVPLLDLRLLVVPALGSSVLMYSLVGIVQSGNGLLLTQHVQAVNERSPVATALFMAYPLGLAIVGVNISTALAKRIKPGRILVAGFTIAMVGELILSGLIVDNGLVVLLTGLTLVLIGTSPIGALSGQIVMQRAPSDRAGVAASLNGTGGVFGSAVGIALFGSLATLFYSGRVPDVDGAPPGAMAEANESLAHAGSAASNLPADVADTLVSASQQAFSQAVGIIAFLCALFFATLAWYARRRLASVLPFGQAEEAEGPHDDTDGPSEGAAATLPDGSSDDASLAPSPHAN